MLAVFGCSGPSETPPESGYTVEGEPTVRVGFYVDGEFAALRDRDPCIVVQGLQGGTWTMPAVRARGIEQDVAIRATLTTTVGELVGEVDALDSLDSVIELEGEPTWVEARRFPIPVDHAAPNGGESIEDLYGQEAILEISLEDDAGRIAEQAVTVTLTEG
jgi:hypothetical protein